MDAELLFYQRIDYDDGAIVEMVLWRVPFLRPLAYVLYRVIARYRYRWFGQVKVD